MNINNKRYRILGIILFLGLNVLEIKADHSIQITGSFEQVAVHGKADIDRIVFTDLLTGEVIEKGVSHNKVNDISKVILSGDQKVRIDIPSDMDVKIEPKPIVFEGQYIHGRDMHYIHVFDVDGEIEINADGYYVHLVRTTGSISVVTYEKIKAILPFLQKSSIVSLDTYLGEIMLNIPKEIEPRIKVSARGEVSIGNEKEPFLMEGPMGNKVILHSEKGKWVNVRSIKETQLPLSNLELRDKLIKIYIEDQGKKRMANISRIELNAMGYGPFIEAMDDVYNGHFYGPKNRTELAGIIDKYGIPTEDMVGSDYALSAVRLVIFQANKEYREKYREQFVEAFGESWLSIKERMENKEK